MTGATRLCEKKEFIQMKIVENAGHQIMLDNPEEVAKHINTSRL